MADLKCCFILVLCLKHSKCAKNGIEGFVVKGSYAKIVDYPHAVFLNVGCSNGYTGWVCGSSILNQMVLVTAAHCLLGCPTTLTVDAYAGHEHLTKVKVIRQSDKQVVHENYNEITVENDIGLVLLEKPLILNQYSKRVIIRNSFPETRQLTATVAGWGTVDDDTGEGTLLLKMVKQKLMSGKDAPNNLAPGMIAAGSYDTDADRPSTGDSGSGLITSSLQQIGLVSYMVQPRRALIIYTNVSYFYPWIIHQSTLLYCDSRWDNYGYNLFL